MSLTSIISALYRGRNLAARAQVHGDTPRLDGLDIILKGGQVGLVDFSSTKP
jgi:hypothetical protein